MPAAVSKLREPLGVVDGEDIAERSVDGAMDVALVAEDV